MFSLALDYFLLVVFATVGLLQVAAALSGLDGMQLLANRRAAGVLGAAILCGAFIWFTLTGDPSIPGDIGGVEGSEQFGLFWGGLAAAVGATYALASVVRRAGRVASRVPPSIEAFRSGDVARAAEGPPIGHVRVGGRRRCLTPTAPSSRRSTALRAGPGR